MRISSLIKKGHSTINSQRKNFFLTKKVKKEYFNQKAKLKYLTGI